MKEDAKVVDLMKIRKKHKRIRNFQKILALLIVIFLSLALYYSREKWMNKIDEASYSLKNKEVMGSNFPLELVSGINYSVGALEDIFLLLSDTQLYVYSLNGELLDGRQHLYSNPILKTVNKKALLYESRGNRFRVESKKRTIYEKELTGKIIYANISNDGYIAVVTTSDSFVCNLTVYDDKGVEIYNVGYTERIVDVSFNSNSTGCVLVSINAIDGQIVSKSVSLSFDSKKINWETENINTFCISSYYTTNGDLFLFGDTKCGYYNNTGKIILGYDYKNSLINANFIDGRAAMLFDNEERRKTSLVLINGKESEPFVVEIDKEIKHMFLENNIVYLMSDNLIQTYNYSGKLMKTVELNDSYKQFYKIKDTIILIGYNKIDKIEFK